MAAGGGIDLTAEIERLDREIDTLKVEIATVGKRLRDYPADIKELEDASITYSRVVQANLNRMNKNTRNAANLKSREFGAKITMRKDTYAKDGPLHLSLVQQLSALQSARKQVNEELERVENDRYRAEVAAQKAIKKAEKEAEQAKKKAERALDPRTPQQIAANTRAAKKAAKNATPATQSKHGNGGAAGGGANRRVNGRRTRRKSTRRNR